jgi:hypothetical protein
MKDGFLTVFQAWLARPESSPGIIQKSGCTAVESSFDPARRRQKVGTDLIDQRTVSGALLVRPASITNSGVVSTPP